MSMIPCGEDCVYQRDGYCSLDIPPVVTNSDFKGCAHKISLEKRHPRPFHSKTVIQPPHQMPPGAF